MKISVVLLTAIVIGSHAKVTNVISKSRAPRSLAAGEAPRKLSLFVRTKQVSDAMIHGESINHFKWTQPLFGASGGPTPVLASSMGGTGLRQPSQLGGGGAGAAGGADCHPKCSWTCGNADCDEVCDPVCAPPQCETACAQINLGTCRQRCDAPKCAIVCPTQHCEHGGCPGCKTICAPPKCTTECSEQCESKCSEPQCTWKCNPGQCEKPRCTLTCGGANTCGLDGNLNARPPPFGAGMTVLAKGLAAVDPKTLSAFAAKGPKGAGKMPSPGGKGKSPAPSGPIR